MNLKQVLIKKIKLTSVLLFLFLSSSTLNSAANSPWGEKYFPNTELVTHEGKNVKFFTDLIENKIVVINFIYTTCPDMCPLETAQLVKVQNIMGDRLGDDIHFYSITIDPEIDTVNVLKEYREQFGAKWTFLTGNRQEIIELRRKLGLYIEGVDDGPNKNNHNVSMIIGNQKTGRWMKRSPFENPYLLADQIGNWLDGWKSPQVRKSYDEAPKLRTMSDGERLFRTRCSSCHSVDGIEEPGDIGPDLVGVTKQRDLDWIVNWLRAPDKMIEEKDPIALALLKKYNNIQMPNLRLNQQEIMDLIDYMNRIPIEEPTQVTVKTEASQDADKLAIMNAWVRQAPPNASVNAGYLTLVNVNDKQITVSSASSDDFATVEFHEMKMVDGMMNMSQIENLTIPSGEQVKLVPGGKHLMLKEPKKYLKEGMHTNIVLHFSDGTSQTLNLGVKKDF